VRLTGGPTSQVRRLGPKREGGLALFCIHRVNRVNSRMTLSHDVSTVNIILVLLKGKKKGKGRYSSSWEPHLRATGRHLLYGITCHPTQVNAPRLTPACKLVLDLPTPER